MITDPYAEREPRAAELGWDWKTDDRCPRALADHGRPPLLDDTDLRNCRLGLRWIQRFRELHGQPEHPAYARALAHLDTELGSACATEPPAVKHNWMTTKQVAERLGCSQRYVRRIATKLGAVKTGRDWRFPPL